MLTIYHPPPHLSTRSGIARGIDRFCRTTRRSMETARSRRTRERRTSGDRRSALFRAHRPPDRPGTIWAVECNRSGCFAAPDTHSCPVRRDNPRRRKDGRKEGWVPGGDSDCPRAGGGLGIRPAIFVYYCLLSGIIWLRVVGIRAIPGPPDCGARRGIRRGFGADSWGEVLFFLPRMNGNRPNRYCIARERWGA